MARKAADEFVFLWHLESNNCLSCAFQIYKSVYVDKTVCDWQMGAKVKGRSLNHKSKLILLHLINSCPWSDCSWFISAHYTKINSSLFSSFAKLHRCLSFIFFVYVTSLCTCAKVLPKITLSYSYSVIFPFHVVFKWTSTVHVVRIRMLTRWSFSHLFF